MRVKNIFLLILATGLFAGCGKKNPPAAPIAAPANVQTIENKIQEPPKEKPLYVYQGDKFRDPFVPAGVTSNYQPDAVFDPKRVLVKAIIFSPSMKSALLSVGGNMSYFVKENRIFDVMGKNVPGYSANIFENKVVLTGEADEVFEYKIRNPEKGEKSL